MMKKIKERLDGGGQIDMLEIGVEEWMSYVNGKEEEGNKIDVRDKL